jgi:hypothetical protein
MEQGYTSKVKEIFKFQNFKEYKKPFCLSQNSFFKYF